MGRLSAHRLLQEGVDDQWLDAAERDRQVQDLEEPWIAEEGPLSVRLSRRQPSAAEPLAPRGLAFDNDTTVHWDEDAVQVVRVGKASADTVAIAQQVLLRQPKHLEDWEGPERFERIDYLEQGVCVASRWRPSSEPPSGDDHA